MSKEKFEIKVNEEKIIRGIKIDGIEKGKTLVVTAGVHGCEYVGIEAVRQVIDEINPDELSGSVILIPVVNESGFYAGLKQVVAEDNMNLNRVFGDNSKDTMSYLMARAIEKNLYNKADFILDLHGGDINEDMTPLLFFPVEFGEEIKNKTVSAAKHLSIKYRVASSSDNGLYSYANKCNVPSLLVERGCKGQFDQNEVNLCKQNIYEMLDFLEIRKYPKTKTEQIEIKKAIYQETDVDGFWYPSKKSNDEIKKGELLGVIKDYYGNTVREYMAAFDGIVLYHTLSLGVNKGSLLIAYGLI